MDTLNHLGRGGGLLVAVIAGYFTFVSLTAKAESPAATDQAKSAPVEFRLRDHLGKEWGSSELADKKAIVLVFLGTDCPLARQYAIRLTDMEKKLAPKGVAFFGVDANRQDTVAKITGFVRDLDISFPILRDPGNKLADALGATRNPEAFVLDGERRVRYQGRIDDQYAPGVARPKASRQDLSEAIGQVLEGKPVTVAKTEAAGCRISRVAKREPTGEVTYSRQVARILQKHCVECHRPGEVAPFPLLTYADASAWAESMVEVIDNGRMPPWFASPKHQTFRNAGHMDDADKKLIAQWVANGCPEGNPSDLPEPAKFVEGWGMDKPDLVVPMSDKPYKVPATGVLDYINYEVDPGFTEEKWFSGAEARPCNRSVVHHILVFVKKPGKKYLRLLPGELIAAYAPGMKATVGDPGMAVRIPAGSKIVFQVHYTPNGVACEDLSLAGFRLADPKDVKIEIESGMAINVWFNIPARADDHEVWAYHYFNRDALLLGVNPHMHLRGKTFRYEAEYPDGRKEILFDCEKFDFNWQIGYQYVKPIQIPKGTRLICRATYDNSENNPSNPDPNRSVSFGEQTSDEMMIGWFYAAYKR